MEIAKVLYRYKEEILADLKCESCGYYTENIESQDTVSYYKKVLRLMICPQCNKRTGPEK